jgi:hypothetical protein
MRGIVLIYKQRLQKERPEIEIPSRNSCSPRHKPLTEKYACVPLIFSPSSLPIAPSVSPLTSMQKGASFHLGPAGMTYWILGLGLGDPTIYEQLNKTKGLRLVIVYIIYIWWYISFMRKGSKLINRVNVTEIDRWQ